MKPKFRERNAIFKRRFQHRIALLFPSTYRASISSLGYQIIYYYLNSFDDIYAERVVADGELPISIETRTPLRKFDLILASAHYELDYVEIVKLLYRAGLNPLKEKRAEDPFLIVGGPSISAWPYPMVKIADAAFLGEFEASGEKFVEALQYIDKKEKKRFLDSLQEVKGVWLPEKGEREIVRVSDLDRAFHPIQQIQNENVEPVWGRSFMLETSRGCSRGCFFCLEAAVSGGRRERSLSILNQLIEKGVEANEVKKVTFFSLSFFDSKTGDELLKRLVEMGIEGSIPSVRAETISEERAELIKKIGQRTVAIAPETARQSLRFEIGKMMRDEDIYRALNALAGQGLSVKLYYMIGLPNESQDDLGEIASQIRNAVKIMGNNRKVKVSINPFIPKPGTIMWKYQMLPLEELKKRIEYLKGSLRGFVNLEIYDPSEARKQYEINIKGEDAYTLIVDEAFRRHIED
ncbi:MAG: radical SAM protein [Fervidicoccaceae archaeon]